MRLAQRIAIVPAAVVLVCVAVAALAPTWITRVDPLAVDVTAALEPPSAEHVFGTDQTGRDLYSRLVHAARLSLGIGVFAAVGALLIGSAGGVLVALMPRWLDALCMRVLDVVLAIPEFLLALVIVAVLGPGVTNIAIAITLASIPVYLRYARGHARSLLGAEFVQSATLLGVPKPLVLIRHVLPGVARRLSVLAVIGIGTAMLSAAGLSFLGLGVADPTPEWGLMLSGGRNVLTQAWWIALFPGLAITLTVVSAATLGRALRTRMERGGRG